MTWHILLFCAWPAYGVAGYALGWWARGRELAAWFEPTGGKS